MAYGDQNWEPESFFDDSGEAFKPDYIASGFDLDPSEYGMYFPKYDDWKTKFAEDDFQLSQEEFTASKTLLDSLKGTQDTRIKEQKEEAGLSLSQGLGASYSQAATEYADVTKQSVQQQVSFTSGVSGRKQEEAFKRTQESLMQNTMEQNLAFTTTSRDLTKQTDDIENQYIFDTGKIGRDQKSAEIDKDYKSKAGKVQWEDSIYDTLKTLAQIGAWDEEEEEKKGFRERHGLYFGENVGAG